MPEARPAHRPLVALAMIIAGSEDHIIPAALNKANYQRYSRYSSVTDYKEFPSRTHFIIGQQGWEEVASYIYSWLESQ
jgi:hypothetical protein